MTSPINIKARVVAGNANNFNAPIELHEKTVTIISFCSHREHFYAVCIVEDTKKICIIEPTYLVCIDENI